MRSVATSVNAQRGSLPECAGVSLPNEFIAEQIPLSEVLLVGSCWGKEPKMKNSGPDTVAAVASATIIEVVDAARNQYETALIAIRRNPLPLVAIAAGIGVICALTVR